MASQLTERQIEVRERTFAWAATFGLLTGAVTHSFGVLIVGAVGYLLGAWGRWRKA